jgi:hypothetical protein
MSPEARATGRPVGTARAAAASAPPGTDAPTGAAPAEPARDPATDELARRWEEVTAARAPAAPAPAPAPEAPPSPDGAAPSTPRAPERGDARQRSAARHPSAGPRGRGRGVLRARKVHRIVRRVDPWSVLKVSLLFYFCVWVMVVISGVLLWGVAVGSGAVDNVESFIAEILALEEFAFDGDQIFRVFALGGLVTVFAVTALTVVLSVLFNLISDLVGGIRLTVIEEETARRIVRGGNR